MRYQIFFMLGLLVAVGSMMLVQHNVVQAKPDQTKFCEQFQNDDGTTGERCEWKSKGECKKDTKEGQDHIDCHKRDKNEEPDGGNNLSPDEDGEGSGSGPND